MPKKEHSIKNKKVKTVNDMIEDLSWIDDFGMMSPGKKLEVKGESLEYFDKLRELRIKLEQIDDIY